MKIYRKIRKDDYVVLNITFVGPVFEHLLHAAIGQAVGYLKRHGCEPKSLAAASDIIVSLETHPSHRHGTRMSVQISMYERPEPKYLDVLWSMSEINKINLDRAGFYYPAAFAKWMARYGYGIHSTTVLGKGDRRYYHSRDYWEAAQGHVGLARLYDKWKNRSFTKCEIEAMQMRDRYGD